MSSPSPRSGPKCGKSTDENGDLKAEYAQPDGYHVKPDGYSVWVEYLAAHT